MSIPNCQHIVAQLAAQYPQEWRDAHNPSGGGPHTEAFIRRLAWVLHSTVDPRFGLNGKRGNPNDLSDDALNFKGVGPGHDPTNGNTPVTVIDCIGGAGGPNPTPQWTVFSDLPGPGAWVQPTAPADAAPVPPQPSEYWTAQHEAIRQRMAGRPLVQLAEQLAYTFPGEGWGQKRTSGGDWSPDTIGRLVDGRLWAVKVSPWTVYGFLGAGHVHRTVSPVNHLGDAPTPEPTPAPTPEPTPQSAPAVDYGPRFDELAAAVAALAVQVSTLQTTTDALRTQEYDIDGNAPFVGRIKGTIRPRS